MGSIRAITGKRLINGAGGIMDDPLIVIENARIRGVGSRGAVEVPSGAAVIDAQDCTLMPGLIDTSFFGPFPGTRSRPNCERLRDLKK
jgi:imidazolonepropionase-like amidohydrolase